MRFGATKYPLMGVWRCRRHNEFADGAFRQFVCARANRACCHHCRHPVSGLTHTLTLSLAGRGNLTTPSNVTCDGPDPHSDVLTANWHELDADRGGYLDHGTRGGQGAIGLTPERHDRA